MQLKVSFSIMTFFLCLRLCTYTTTPKLLLSLGCWLLKSLGHYCTWKPLGRALLKQRWKLTTNVILLKSYKYWDGTKMIISASVF